MLQFFFNLVSLLFFSIMASAQGSLGQLFELRVKIPDGSPDSIWIMYSSGTGRYVKVLEPIKEGQLMVHDTLIEPVSITLRVPVHKAVEEVELEFFVEAGGNMVKILHWAPLEAHYPDHPTQQLYSHLQVLLKTAGQKYDSVILALTHTLASLDLNLNADEADKLNTAIDSVRTDKWRMQAMVRKKFVEQNPSAWICVRQFYTLIDYFPIEELITLYERIPAAVRATASGKSIEDMLTAIAQSQPGKMFPALEAIDRMGKQFSSTNYAGKGPVLFDFWASWCGPCIQDFPAVLALARQYAAQGLRIVFVSIDGEEAGAWQDALHKYGLSGFEHFLVDGSSMDTITSQLAVQGIPDKILIDPNGTIVYRRVGSGTDALAAALKQMMDHE